jgi:hypothetical protein
MDNKVGLSILSAVLDKMSYPNQISGPNKLNATDVRDLHKYLMGVCNKSDWSALDFLHSLHNTLQMVLSYNAVGCVTAGASFDGGSSSFGTVLPPSLLDEHFHYDFTNISDNGVEFFRGQSIYTRPCGWQRYALKVKGKYPDDIWLEGKTPRTDEYKSAEDEWAVSYHGTSYHNGLSIAEEGYKLSQGTRFLYGKGIYSTPDIEVASLYAITVNANGKTYEFVLQNRVNHKNVIKIDKAETGVGEYWISPTDDDIRPYGFCVREVDSDSSDPAPAPPSKPCFLL